MRISDWSSDVCSSDLTRRRPGISRAISTAKKPKVMVAIVTAIDGKPKPSGAVGGLGMSTTAPSSAVSTRPKASAASQCAAAAAQHQQIPHAQAQPQDFRQLALEHDERHPQRRQRYARDLAQWRPVAEGEIGRAHV